MNTDHSVFAPKPRPELDAEAVRSALWEVLDHLGARRSCKPDKTRRHLHALGYRPDETDAALLVAERENLLETSPSSHRLSDKGRRHWEENGHGAGEHHLHSDAWHGRNTAPADRPPVSLEEGTVSTGRKVTRTGADE